MHTHKALLSFFFLTLSSFIYAQSLSSGWSTELHNSIEEFKNCKNNGTKSYNPCSRFIGESLNIVYGSKDFYSKDLDRYLTGTEIIKFLESSETWKKMDPAYQQSTLDEAQELANAGNAVVAVYLDKDQLGNVSIILPGKVSASGSWELSVPNSVTYFVNAPERSYLNKGLSYAFTRNMIKDVILYKKVN